MTYSDIQELGTLKLTNRFRITKGHTIEGTDLKYCVQSICILFNSTCLWTEFLLLDIVVAVSLQETIFSQSKLTVVICAAK